MVEGMESFANAINSGNTTEKSLGASIIAEGQDMFLKSLQDFGLIDSQS